MLRVPKGYVIAHEAILRVAQAQNPKLWRSIRPDEKSVWTSACKEFDGRFLPMLLEKHSLSAEMPRRLAKYVEIRLEFKEWLQDNNTFEALCCALDWYFDRPDDGREDDHVNKVFLETEFWRSLRADGALISSKFEGGYGPLPGAVIVLFREASISDMEAGIKAQREFFARHSAIPSPSTQPKRSQASEEEIRTAFWARFAGWPAGSAHPSEKEDIIALQATLGRPFDRKLFRKIRHEIAPEWASRGRPSAPPSAKTAKK